MQCFPSWGRVQMLQLWGESLWAVRVWGLWQVELEYFCDTWL